MKADDHTVGPYRFRHPGIVGAQHTLDHKRKLGRGPVTSHVVQRLVSKDVRSRHLIPRLFEKEHVDIHAHGSAAKLCRALDMAQDELVVLKRLDHVQDGRALVDDAAQLLEGNHARRHHASRVGEPGRDLF